MILNILVSAFFVLWLFAEIVYFTFGAHMFQLNSYGAGEHIAWMKKNPSTNFKHIVSAILGALLCLLLFIFRNSYIFTAIVIAIFILDWIALAVSTLPKKNQKTPFKYTSRVKRLLVTYILIMLILGAVSVIFALKFNSLYFLALQFVVYAVSPFIILLCNLINKPVEKAVKNYYLKDAKRILAECKNLKVIGITGSFGKTSMKHFLSTIMMEKYNVLIPPKNFNTPMGLCITIRSYLRGYHDFFICEMGARATGEIKELCDFVHPGDGIITSIGPMHLETFGSIENIIKTKFELSDAVGSGRCFFNIDNGYIRENLPEDAVTYGLSDDAMYRGVIKSISRKGTSFDVIYPDKTCHTFNTTLIGGHNVQNLCGAVAMAKHFGVSDNEIERGISKITAVEHRLQLRQQGNDTIIDDAYNSNPAGCRAALEVLSYLEGTKILVTPGMVELGEKQYDLNFEFGAEAADVCDYVVLVGEKQTKPILDGLLSKGYNNDNIYVATNLNDALLHAKSFYSENGRVILLENDLPDNYLN